MPLSEAAAGKRAASRLWRNRAKTLNERARMFDENPHHFLPGELRWIVERDGSRCVYCDKELDYLVSGEGRVTRCVHDRPLDLPCVKCAARFEEGLRLVVPAQEGDASFDHIIRLVDGGSNTPENVVCSCRSCNQKNNKKSAEDPEAAAIERLRWFLARKPGRAA